MRRVQLAGLWAGSSGVTTSGGAQARQILLPSPTEGLGKHRAAPCNPRAKALGKEQSLQIRATRLHEEPRETRRTQAGGPACWRSQNHRMAGVGRDLRGSPSPTLLPSQATAHLHCCVLQPPPPPQPISRESSCPPLLAAVSSTLEIFINPKRRYRMFRHSPGVPTAWPGCGFSIGLLTAQNNSVPLPNV